MCRRAAPPGARRARIPHPPLSGELEYRPPLQNDVQLLGRVRLGLVVLVDDPVARVTGRPGVDTEGRDAEVVPDRSKRLAPVVPLVDLVQSRDCVVPHPSPLTSYVTYGRDRDSSRTPDPAPVGRIRGIGPGGRIGLRGPKTRVIVLPAAT